MVKKRNNPSDGKPQQLDVSGDDPLKKLLQHVALELERGNGLEAMRLFTEGQAQHVLTTTPNLPRQLVNLMGKKKADKLIAVFVHSSCPFCKKGCQKCENCEGHGHIDHEMVCTDCLSLGLIKCDFCDGSGWSSIDSIPAGLRPVVLYQRTKVAIARIEKIFSKPTPQIARRKPVIILKKCAQLLMDLNRYVGVLENTVVGKDELTKSHHWSKSKVKKIVISCIQAAISAEKRAREIVEHMAKIARMQAEEPDQDETAKRLARTRSEFYESLLNSSNIFAGTNLEHPFLNEAMKKLDSKRSDTKKGNQIIL